MIASHSSFSYLEPTYSLYGLLKGLWKTQNKTIEQQYTEGVRYFDIRVYWHNGFWRICYSLINFDWYYTSLDDLARYFFVEYPEAEIRIILEKGNTKQFRKEAELLLLPNVDWIAIKGGETLRRSSYPIVDYSQKIWDHQLSWITNLYNMIDDHDIKKMAYINNPIVTDKMIRDKNIVYFLDFI